MIGSECIHKKTGHIGKINRELKGTGISDKWGIYWYSGNEGAKYAKHIQKFGLQYYWNDKENIKINFKKN